MMDPDEITPPILFPETPIVSEDYGNEALIIKGPIMRDPHSLKFKGLNQSIGPCLPPVFGRSRQESWLVELFFFHIYALPSGKLT